MIFRCAIKYTALLLLAVYLLHPTAGLGLADCTFPRVEMTTAMEASRVPADHRDSAPADDRADGTANGCCCDLDCPCDAVAPLPMAALPPYLPTMARLAVADPFRAPPQVYLGKFIPPQNHS